MSGRGLIECDLLTKAEALVSLMLNEYSDVMYSNALLSAIGKIVILRGHSRLQGDKITKHFLPSSAST